MLYYKIKALKPKVNNRSVQTNFSTINQISNPAIGTHNSNLQSKNQRFQNIVMEDRSQRLNELESVIQYLSLFKRIKESHSQKKSQNQCPQITNLSVDCLQKSCVKTRNFNTKIWSKVNCDEDSYAGRKFSIEKVETNRDSKISPCLKVSQAIRFQRSNSYLTNLRTEMKRNILNQNQYSRSRSVMRQNVLLVFVENYLTKNQGTKRI